MKTLYEVNWHYTNDTLSHISVTPIRVLRESVLPGCSAVSITAVDVTGATFQGSPRNYFESEKEAWEEAKQDLQRSIDAEEAEIARAQDRIHAMFGVLMKVASTLDERENGDDQD